VERVNGPFFGDHHIVDLGLTPIFDALCLLRA